MAATKDTTASGEGASVSSKSVSIVVNANRDRYLLAFIEASTETDTVSSVVYNGSEALSLIGTIAGSTNVIWVYGLANPTAATANVVVTFGASVNRCMVGVMSCYNVRSNAPIGTVRTATGSTNNPFVACDEGVEGDLAIGFCSRESAGSGVQTITSVGGIPKFIAVGTLSTAAAQTSRTPALPANLLVGDLIFATCASENNADHSCPTTGWVKLGQTNSGAGWTTSHWCAIQTAAGLAAPVISWTGSADANAQTACYRDTQATGAAAAYLGTVGTGTGTTHTSTGANTTKTDTRVVYIDHANANTALGAPAGWTENVDAGSATGPCRIVWGGKDVATLGTGSGNISVTGANAAWVQQQIEAYPAANGDQTSQINIAHTANNETMEVATESADVFNTFGWVTAGDTVQGTVAMAFVLHGSKSDVPVKNQMNTFLAIAA